MKKTALAIIALCGLMMLSACTTDALGTPSVAPPTQEDATGLRDSPKGETLTSKLAEFEWADDPLQIIPNPSTLAPQPEDAPTEDERLIPIYRFFYRYYNTFVTLQTQEFSDIMMDNENTQIMWEMLRVQAAQFRLDGIWFKDYSFTLRNVKTTRQDDNSQTITLYCLCENHFADAPQGIDSGEGVNFQFRLGKKDGVWMIEEVEVVGDQPHFYNGFINVIDKFKTSELSLESFANLRIRYLIRLHEAVRVAGRPLTQEEGDELEEKHRGEIFWFGLRFPTEERQTYLSSIGLGTAPVDIHDLAALERVYVSPLSVRPFLYPWENAEQMMADDLIYFCTLNNLLNLPTDVEGGYSAEDGHPPAKKVETALQKYFDVSAEHLRSSRWYSAEDNTYSLVIGGSGVSACVTSAKQEGQKLHLEIVLLSWPDSDWSVGNEEMPRGTLLDIGLLLTPAGTLTVEIDGQGGVKYLSFAQEPGFRWYT